MNGNAHIVTEATDKTSFTRADATLAVDVARIQTDFAESECLQVRVFFLRAFSLFLGDGATRNDICAWHLLIFAFFCCIFQFS